MTNRIKENADPGNYSLRVRIKRGENETVFTKTVEVKDTQEDKKSEETEDKKPEDSGSRVVRRKTPLEELWSSISGLLGL